MFNLCGISRFQHLSHSSATRVQPTNFGLLRGKPRILEAEICTNISLSTLHIPLRDNARKIMLLVCMRVCVCVVYGNSRFANIGTWKFRLYPTTRETVRKKREIERKTEFESRLDLLNTDTIASAKHRSSEHGRSTTR